MKTPDENWKPREFWLDLATTYGDPCDFVSEGKPHEMPAATNIHVIEYRAIETRDKQIEILEAAIKTSLELDRCGETSCPIPMRAMCSNQAHQILRGSLSLAAKLKEGK